MLPYVPTHHQHDRGAICKREKGIDRRQRFDLDALALHRSLRRDGALFEPHLAGSGDAFHRAQEVDKRGEIVWTHVEHRPAARLEEKHRVRMPVLHPVRQHRGGSGHDLAGVVGVNHTARRLDAGAEDSIGGAADFHAPAPCRLHDRLAVLERYCQRLFGVDMLAGIDCGERYIDMSGRNCQVQHYIDIVALQELAWRNRRQTVFGTLRLRGINIYVRHRDEAYVAKER